MSEFASGAGDTVPIATEISTPLTAKAVEAGIKLPDSVVRREQQAASRAAIAENSDAAAVEASPTEPIADNQSAEAERTDAAEITKESIEEPLLLTVERAIKSKTNEASSSLSSDLDIQKSQVEGVYKGLFGVRNLDRLNQKQIDQEGGEIRFKENDAHVLIMHEGRQVRLVSIQQVEGDLFTCNAIDTEANKELGKITIPRRDAVKAQIVAEKENIVSAMPENQQKVVRTGIDLMSYQLQLPNAKNPLDNMTSDDLKNLDQEIVQTIKEQAESEKDIPKWSLSKELGKDMSGNAFEEYYSKGIITKKEVEETTTTLANELFSKKPNLLTTEETKKVNEVMKEKLVDAKANDEIFQRERDMPYQYKMYYSRELERHKVETDEPANDEQAKEIKLRILREGLLGEKISKLSDSKYMEEIRRKFGWKDLAGLILFLTKDIGENFAPNMQQHR